MPRNSKVTIALEKADDIDQNSVAEDATSSSDSDHSDDDVERDEGVQDDGDEEGNGVKEMDVNDKESAVQTKLKSQSKNLKATSNDNSVFSTKSFGPVKSSGIASKRSIVTTRSNSRTSTKSTPSTKSVTIAKNASSAKSIGGSFSKISAKSLAETLSKMTSKSSSSTKSIGLKRSKSATKSTSSTRSITAPESLLEEEMSGIEADPRPVFEVLHQFGKEINKSMNSKRRKVEKFTKECDATRQRLDSMIETQKNKRAMLYEEFNKAVQILMGAWENDMEKMKCSEEKLNSLLNQQSKIFNQRKTAQTQRYKAMKELHNEFIKSLAAMESSHNNQQQAAVKTSSKDLHNLQQKFLMDVNNRDYTTVRRSLQCLVQK